jgi:hypothetical protein
MGVYLCMSLSHDHSHDLGLRLFCYMEGIYDRSAWVSFLCRWSKILLPVLWWPAIIRIDDVHMFGIATLIIIVMGSCSFIWF